MDRKAKKKLETMRNRQQKLQQQLSGAKKQIDEPGEIQRLESEIATIESEIEKLKKA
ncbi:MAG: hypothetical protein N2C14_16225 [Planctomycetales bacterium]